MIAALTLLLVLQLIGEIIARGLDLPIPGPVIGMMLLFLGLVLRGGPSETAGSLLQHLSLLFIPAGAGIMLYRDLIAAEWLPLAAALLGSTVLAIVVTALVLDALVKRHEPAEPGEGSKP